MLSNNPTEQQLKHLLCLLRGFLYVVLQLLIMQLYSVLYTIIHSCTIHHSFKGYFSSPSIYYMSRFFVKAQHIPHARKYYWVLIALVRRLLMFVSLFSLYTLFPKCIFTYHAFCCDDKYSLDFDSNG